MDQITELKAKRLEFDLKISHANGVAKKSLKSRTIKSKSLSLQKGDLIEIIAPGSSAPFENLEKGAAVLKSWGYEVRYQADLLNPQMYLAHTDEYRLKNLKRALLDPKVKAIWCLRGGYGSIRLIPELLKLKAPQNKKLLIGFSDITSIHLFLNQKWNWPALHGPLIDRLATGKIEPAELQELQESLATSNFEVLTENLIPMNALAQKKKTIKAPITGGNLVVATSSLGSKNSIKGRGKILFFEEIAERGYRVDRCLHQLQQAGVFDGVKAVILGDFINGLESDGRDLVWPTLENFFAKQKFPVFKGVQMGHGTKQRPLFFGTTTILTCGPQARMVNYSPS